MVGIPLGRFVPVDSVIHKLSPVAKTISFVSLAVGSLFLSGFGDFTVFFSLWIILSGLSAVPFREYMKALRGIRLLILLIVVFQILFSHGKVLLDLKVLRITEEGLINSVLLSGRMILAVLFSIVLSLTTSPLEISFSVEEIVSKFPASRKRSSELGMALSLTLTFIPLISLQTNRIIMAQKARGVDFDRGSITSKVKNSLSVVIPVITTSLKKAQDTAVALQIRGYKPGQKLTSLREKSWSSNDSILLVVTVLSILSAIIL